LATTPKPDDRQQEWGPVNVSGGESRGPSVPFSWVGGLFRGIARRLLDEVWLFLQRTSRCAQWWGTLRV